jgi:hypothetical protein
MEQTNGKQLSGITIIIFYRYESFELIKKLVYIVEILGSYCCEDNDVAGCDAV